MILYGGTVYNSSRGEFEMCISDKFNNEGIGSLDVFGRIFKHRILVPLMRRATVIRASLEIRDALKGNSHMQAGLREKQFIASRFF